MSSYTGIGKETLSPKVYESKNWHKKVLKHKKWLIKKYLYGKMHHYEDLNTSTNGRLCQ